MTGGVVYTKDNKVKAELNVIIRIINLPGRNVSSVFLSFPQPSIASLENQQYSNCHLMMSILNYRVKKISLIYSFSSLPIPFPVPVSLELSLVLWWIWRLIWSSGPCNVPHCPHFLIVHHES